MTRSLAHQSLNKQNQLHGAADMLEAELGETIHCKAQAAAEWRAGSPVELASSHASAGSAPRSYLWLSPDGLAKLMNRIHTNERAGNQNPVDRLRPNAGTRGSRMSGGERE